MIKVYIFCSFLVFCRSSFVSKQNPFQNSENRNVSSIRSVISQNVSAQRAYWVYRFVFQNNRCFLFESSTLPGNDANVNDVYTTESYKNEGTSFIISSPEFNQRYCTGALHDIFWRGGGWRLVKENGTTVNAEGGERGTSQIFQNA